MNTQVLYKRANVSRSDAFAALYKKYPGARLVDFETKKATREAAQAAKVKVGELIYEATVHLAEFPPSDDGSGEEEAPEPKEEPKDDGGDDAPSFDDKADGGEGGGLGEPKKMKPEEQMVHLLTQILDALKGGGGPGLDDGLGGPPGLGAGPPPAKAPMGAPKPGGMAGGPMPPPAAPKPPMGGAFAHYNPEQSEIVTIRRKASEKGNKALIAEAAETFPTHKVAKIQRTEMAVLNGKTYNLAKNDIAVVTLIKR